VVLPTGHIYREDGAPEFNTAEIPPHLLPAVQAELSRPVIVRPERTAETAYAVSIPKLRLEQTIVQGTDWEALRMGVGQVLNGANPSDPTGNVALAAHNDIYGELFRDLDQLEPGDQITIRTENRIYTYEVYDTEFVGPTDVQVLESKGRPTLTLISCYPYQQNTERIVVYANRLDDF
jgi:sortase A